MAVFKYRARSAEDWDKRANQRSGDFESFIHDDFTIWSPKKGTNAIRILPPTFDDPDHYGINIYVHYNIGPNKASVLCLSQMKNQRCPVCESRNKLLKLGEEDEAKELKAGKRVLVWMLDRTDTGRGPMLWAMPYTLDKDFCGLAKDPQTGEISPIDHPDDGFDIYFDKSGDGMLTQYSNKKLAKRSSPVSDEALNYVEDRPLPKTLVWRTYDEIKELYEGGPSEDNAPAVNPRSNPPRRGGAEEEPPPSRRTNGVSHDDAAPTRRVQTVAERVAAREPEPVRRRVQAPEPDGEPVRRSTRTSVDEVPDRRAEMNRDVPWNEGETDAVEAEPVSKSVAERLSERYRERRT